MKTQYRKKRLLSYITCTLLLACICIFSSATTVYACEQDPSAGRLSGKNIDSGFYDKKASTYEYERFGSSKTKSPYTGVKYTHQSKFDDRTILHGIDISKWQGYIDWQKVKADGIDYAFIQVGFRGYGSSGLLSDATKDPYFDYNMQGAINAGIKVGVYVFSQAITEAEAIEEAEYILDAIGSYKISMPLVLDYEYASTDTGLGGRLYNAKLSKAKATKVCMAFCKEIDAAGFTPMIYANKSMLSDQLDANQFSNAGYRIWLANYTQKTTYSGNFDFWQYSEKGKVDGISGDVDMNFYYAQPDDCFEPDPMSISSSVFSKVEDYIYTGAAITPSMTVTNNGVVLTPNVDYTISYQNNTKIGTATITITGIGKYCDVRKFHFDILPKEMSAPKAKKRTTNYITLSWSKDSSISGYEIYRAPSIIGTYKKIKTINKKSTTTYKDKKLTSGKCYYYKICSFKKVNGKTYYSKLGQATAIYTKTGYTKNAITKSKISLYDYIPGTKTQTQLVPVEPTTEQPTTEAPTTEQTTSEETTTTEPTTEQATSEETTTTEPTTEQATSEETTTTEPTTEQATSEETTMEQTTIKQPSSEGTNASTKEVPMKEETVVIDSTVVVEVAKKAKLKVIYSSTYNNKTWYYVSYKKNGITYKGFAEGKKLTVTKLGKIVKTKKVNVRKKASAYSKRLTTLKKNTKVDILKTKKKKGVTWYQVQYKKKGKTYKGWISSPYIKII